MSAVLLSRQGAAAGLRPGVPHLLARPEADERMMQLLLPKAHGRAASPRSSRASADRRALRQNREESEKNERVEYEARLTFSSREVLSRMDFDTMSAAELAQAKQMLAELRLPLPLIRTRRKEISRMAKPSTSELRCARASAKA